MILTPQETEIMRGRPYDKIISSLSMAIATNQLKPFAESNGCVLGVIDEGLVLPFTLPVRVKNAMGKNYYCIDLRKSNRDYKLLPDGSGIAVNLLTETNFNFHHALAQKVWIEQMGLFNPVYFQAAKLYALWLSVKLSKRLSLPINTQNELTIYFAYFFITRTYRSERLSGNEMMMVAGKICNLFGFNIHEVNEILGVFDSRIPEGLDELCTTIAKTNHNPKLQKFSRVLVQSMVVGNWLGANGRELTALATEYPPTFMTMIYRTLNERSFKDTDIAQLSLKVMNSAAQKQYNLVYADILHNAAMTDY